MARNEYGLLLRLDPETESRWKETVAALNNKSQTVGLAVLKWFMRQRRMTQGAIMGQLSVPDDDSVRLFLMQSLLPSDPERQVELCQRLMVSVTSTHRGQNILDPEEQQHSPAVTSGTIQLPKDPAKGNRVAARPARESKSPGFRESRTPRE